MSQSFDSSHVFQLLSSFFLSRFFPFRSSSTDILSLASFSQLTEGQSPPSTSHLATSFSLNHRQGKPCRCVVQAPCARSRMHKTAHMSATLSCQWLTDVAIQHSSKVRFKRRTTQASFPNHRKFLCNTFVVSNGKPEWGRIKRVGEKEEEVAMMTTERYEGIGFLCSIPSSFHHSSPPMIFIVIPKRLQPGL